MFRTIASALTLLLLMAAPATARSRKIWTASWLAPPAPPLASSPSLPAAALARSFRNQTINQTVRLSAGGTGLRVRLTNEYGTAPLKIGKARVVLIDEAGMVVAGSARTLTFGGQTGTVIPPGAPWLSDVVDLPVAPRARLRVSLYFPDDTGLCTCHAVGGDTSTISPPGDFTDKPFTSSTTFIARAFISEVDVSGVSTVPVVVAFGDSITDGYMATNGKDRRWPDRLAERLAANPAYRSIGVANAGLSGNRILADGFITLFGQSAVARFDRDALSVPGVSTVIVLEGVNDIGDAADDPPSAASLIDGYRQIIGRAHAKGVKVIGGTILPYEGAKYFRAAGDLIRQAVNEWIRKAGEFDGVVDFDQVMRDPSRPSRLRADLQSGDWLHPNDAGYRVMGNAVDLSTLK